MEEQVGHHKVERSRGEGEGEGVGGDAGSVAVMEVGFAPVEADDACVGEAGGVVCGGGADVEDGEPGALQRAEDRPQGLAAAEVAIDALEVAEVGRDFGWRGRI